MLGLKDVTLPSFEVEAEAVVGDYPEEKDWRQSGNVTGVKDQG